MVVYVTLPVRSPAATDLTTQPTSVVLVTDGTGLVTLGAAPWVRGLARYASLHFVPGDPATALGAFCMRTLSSYAPVLGPWELALPLDDAVEELAGRYDLPRAVPQHQAV